MNSVNTLFKVKDWHFQNKNWTGKESKLQKKTIRREFRCLVTHFLTDHLCNALHLEENNRWKFIIPRDNHKLIVYVVQKNKDRKISFGHMAINKTLEQFNIKFINVIMRLNLIYFGLNQLVYSNNHSSFTVIIL